MEKAFQRKGVSSNTQVGKEFEFKIQKFFTQQGIKLEPNFSISIGITQKKAHRFDFGNSRLNILVECKSHTWTEGKNVPSAKMTTWDQAMFYFYIAPREFRKVFFVLKDYSQERDETLAHYYIRTNYHLIPEGVEIWEFDETNNTAEILLGG